MSLSFLVHCSNVHFWVLSCWDLLNEPTKALVAGSSDSEPEMCKRGSLSLSGMAELLALLAISVVFKHVLQRWPSLTWQLAHLKQASQGKWNQNCREILLDVLDFFICFVLATQRDLKSNQINFNEPQMKCISIMIWHRKVVYSSAWIYIAWEEVNLLKGSKRLDWIQLILTNGRNPPIVERFRERFTSFPPSFLFSDCLERSKCYDTSFGGKWKDKGKAQALFLLCNW